MRNPKGIVVHHSDTEQGGVISFRRTHIEWGWSDIGYHFVILKDGTVEIGRPLSKKGAHARGNNSTIGICLVGKLGKKAPTPEQLQSLVRLITSLCFIFNFDPKGTYKHKGKDGDLISGHKDWCLTDCPGTMFYDLLPSIRSSVKAKLEKHVNDLI
jgi:hypothetical protein